VDSNNRSQKVFRFFVVLQMEYIKRIERQFSVELPLGKIG
jgi:hypothetical protein